MEENQLKLEDLGWNPRFAAHFAEYEVLISKKLQNSNNSILFAEGYNLPKKS